MKEMLKTLAEQIDKMRVNPVCEGNALLPYTARVNENFARALADCHGSGDQAGVLLVEIFAIRVAACALLIAERAKG